MIIRVICLICVICVTVFAQQVPDPGFDTSVKAPAYEDKGPRVMFDEAHNNFHTVEGRYKPFVEVLRNDGYTVVANRLPFTKARLSGFKILVIANALGAEEDDDEGADKSAFTDEEIRAVVEWVKDGGAFLLIADHAPFGGAAAALSNQFGVDMSKGYTFDTSNSVENQASHLIFSRQNKLLGDHPIMEGRREHERINLLRSFTGQSLKASDKGAVALLRLANSAMDRATAQSEASVSAEGRAQAVALKFGKGRVLVQGEAAMLTAQLAGPQNRPMGMNAPGNDNKQYLLNVMHWLSGILK